MEIEKNEKTGEFIKSYLPALLSISLGMNIVLAITIPHFKSLNMRNLQHEIRVCQKHHNKVTMILCQLSVSFFESEFIPYKCPTTRMPANCLA